MKQEIKIPAMGESITEATVGQILKPTGSHVKMDDEVVELETDKVNQVLYAPQDGIVTLHVSTDDVVSIGQVIGEVEGEISSKIEKKPVEEVAKKPVSVTKNSEAISEMSKGIRLSKEAFIEEVLAPSSVSPKGPVATQPEIPIGERTETRHRMTKIRRVIASRLVEAQRTTAMLTTFNEVDMTEIIALRAKYKELFLKEFLVKLGFMSFFVKATVSGLKTFPDVNGYIEEDEIIHRHYYDIGIAVGTERGLVVPVIRDCDQRSFGDIEKAIADFAQKARGGTLSVDDLQGGGFTITNGGIYGSLLSTPILNPPQSAILGMHKIQKRPIVIDDQMTVRPMMYLALSYDHRIVDGKQAVTFLVQIKNCLEDPARLLFGV